MRRRDHAVVDVAQAADQPQVLDRVEIGIQPRLLGDVAEQRLIADELPMDVDAVPAHRPGRRAASAR